MSLIKLAKEKHKKEFSYKEHVGNSTLLGMGLGGLSAGAHALHYTHGAILPSAVAAILGSGVGAGVGAGLGATVTGPLLKYNYNRKKK